VLNTDKIQDVVCCIFLKYKSKKLFEKRRKKLKLILTMPEISSIMLYCKVMYPKGGLICSEHINPRSSTERRSTASERECPTETDVRFLLAEEQKAERDFLTN